MIDFKNSLRRYLDNKLKVLILSLSIILYFSLPYHLYGQEIQNSYSHSTINGNSIVGGIAGKLADSSLVNLCYSKGKVQSENGLAGGLIADKSAESTIENSYWDQISSGLETSAGGNPRITEEMTYPKSGTTYVNWDFSTVWSEDRDGSNNGYPYFSNKVPVLQTLILESEPISQGETAGTGKYSYGASILAAASPNLGYSFLNWTNASGSIISDQANYSFYMPSTDLILRANFDFIEYAVNVTIEPKNGGVVSGTGTYHIDDNVLLKASPNEGFEFEFWKDETGSEIHFETDYSFIMLPNDIDLTAQFKIITGTSFPDFDTKITVIPNPFYERILIDTQLKKINLLLINSEGKTVLTIQEFFGGTIGTKHLSPGFYTLMLSDINGKTYFEKLVKY